LNTKNLPFVTFEEKFRAFIDLADSISLDRDSADVLDAEQNLLDEVERTIKLTIDVPTRCFRLQAFFAKMSMTEPSLSSLAGMTPPNPVLAVISGNLELEPFNFSFDGDFLTKLFVTSGMEFRLLNLKLVFMVEDEVTNPLVMEFTIPPPILKFGFGRLSMSKLLGPFDTDRETFSLVLTKDGALKLKRFSASDTHSALTITDFGTEKLKVRGGLMGLVALALIIFAATLDSALSLVLDPLALVELTWLGFTGSVEIPLPAPDFCFLGESHLSFSSITLFKGHLLLFLSIISGDSLEGRIGNPLVVLGGGLVAEVVEKLRTGIVSTWS
jgi:hypothetical protein